MNSFTLWVPEWEIFRIEHTGFRNFWNSILNSCHICSKKWLPKLDFEYLTRLGLGGRWFLKFTILEMCTFSNASASGCSVLVILNIYTQVYHTYLWSHYSKIRSILRIQFIRFRPCCLRSSRRRLRITGNDFYIFWSHKSRCLGA